MEKNKGYFKQCSNYSNPETRKIRLNSLINEQKHKHTDQFLAPSETIKGKREVNRRKCKINMNTTAKPVSKNDGKCYRTMT